MLKCEDCAADLTVLSKPDGTNVLVSFCKCDNGVPKRDIGTWAIDKFYTGAASIMPDTSSLCEAFQRMAHLPSSKGEQHRRQIEGDL